MLLCTKMGEFIMKKQILALCALVLVGNLVAKAPKTAAEQLIAFNTMELGRGGHKEQWFDYMQKGQADKVALLKKHHAEWATFKNSQIKALSDMEDASHAAREKFFQEELKQAIALHKKQMAEWEKLCKSHAEEAQKIAAKHKAELAAFEKQL